MAPLLLLLLFALAAAAAGAAPLALALLLPLLLLLPAGGLPAAVLPALAGFACSGNGKHVQCIQPATMHARCTARAVHSVANRAHAAGPCHKHSPSASAPLKRSSPSPYSGTACKNKTIQNRCWVTHCTHPPVQAGGCCCYCCCLRQHCPVGLALIAVVAAEQLRLLLLLLCCPAAGLHAALLCAPSACCSA